MCSNEIKSTYNFINFVIFVINFFSFFYLYINTIKWKFQLVLKQNQLIISL